MHIIVSEYKKMANEFRVYSKEKKPSSKVWELSFKQGLYSLRGFSCFGKLCTSNVNGEVCRAHPIFVNLSGIKISKNSYLSETGSGYCLKTLYYESKNEIKYKIKCISLVRNGKSFKARKVVLGKLIKSNGRDSYSVYIFNRMRFNNSIVSHTIKRSLKFIKSSCVIKEYHHRSSG